MVTDAELYEKAQLAIISLKSAVLMLLNRQGGVALRNSEIGRTLGIYDTNDGQQTGWVSMYILEQLEVEGRVRRIKPGGKWSLAG